MQNRAGLACATCLVILTQTSVTAQHSRNALEEALDLARDGMAELEQATLRGDPRSQDDAAETLQRALLLLEELADQIDSRSKRADELTRRLEDTRSALFWHHQMEMRRRHFESDSAGVQVEANEAELRAEEIASALLSRAREFERRHPDEPLAARDRFALLVEEHPGTLAALHAEEEVRRIDYRLAAAEAREEPSPPEGGRHDLRPYWRRVADRLAAIEPGDTGSVRDDVRNLLERRDYVKAFDRARRARAAADDAQERAALSTLVRQVKRALETLGFAVDGGSDLVGQTHVFRLQSGAIYAGTVKSFDGSRFVLQAGDGEVVPVPLSSLSALGLVQVATSSGADAHAFQSAAYLFLLRREFRDMDRYLQLSRKRGSRSESLEVAASIARELELLRKELPTARSAWRKVDRAARKSFERIGKGDYHGALLKLKKVLHLVRDEDFPALDEIAHETMQVGLDSLLDEARGSCRIKHVDETENLVKCSTCGGDGIHTKLRDPVTRGRVDPRALECQACSGEGLSPCGECGDRFHDAGLRELHDRVKKALGEE